MRRLIPFLLLWPLLAPAQVAVTTARLADIVNRPVQSAPASVVARSAPALASEIHARIETIPVRVGDIVTTDTIVVRLDCRLYESQLAGARATVKQLEAQRDFATGQLERALSLQAKKGISEELVDQRRSELAGLEAQLAAQHESVRQASLQVDRCDVRAPFDAVVTTRLAAVGGLASPGTELVRLVELVDPEVSAALREPEAADLADAVSSTFVWNGQSFPLSIRALLPVVNERTRTREARLTFKGSSAPAGAAGRLQWQTGNPQLPPEYVVRRGDSLGVFLVDGDRARFHPLPRALEGQPVAVGLPEDTLIVVDGRYRLADGDTVAH